jgi:RraA family protein
MDFPEIKKRLADLDTAAICDANKSIRVLDPSIRPINPAVKLIGIARTVACHDDFLTVIKALAEAAADDVLVVDAQGGQRALAGELFSMEAQRKKLGGIVIDGSIRDIKTVKTLNIAVYARSICPMAGTTAKIFSSQIPVTVGGITIAPGDILFGDEDGVIVASEAELSDLIPRAEEIQKKEKHVIEQLLGGTALTSMLNFSEHYQKICSKQESQLRFSL